MKKTGIETPYVSQGWSPEGMDGGIWDRVWWAQNEALTCVFGAGSLAFLVGQ